MASCFGGFFKDFGLSFKPISIPTPKIPDFGLGLKKETAETQIITETTTPEGEKKK